MSFDPGLNVVIGPRGAGKTTLLELIRHALGTPHADKNRSAREVQRVRSLLGNGEVVLDLEENETSHRLVVDAEGGGRRPELASLALMLGQNELEAIASDAESRRRLIDLRAQIGPRDDHSDPASDITTQLSELRQELSDLEDRTRQRPLLQADLEILAAEEATLMGRVSSEMGLKRQKLQEIEAELLHIQTSETHSVAAFTVLSNLERLTTTLDSQLRELDAIPLGGEDKAIVEETISDSRQGMNQVTSSIRKAEATLQASASRRASKELELRGEAEPIRSELNDAERGLGEVTAKARNIRSQLAVLAAEQNRLRELNGRYAALREERDSLLNELEAANELRYEKRQRVASEVSQNLGARVTVSIEHLADYSVFRDLLSAGLQGSGLKYSSIAEIFARTLLPRQLLSLIETNDVATASSATELPEERVSRALNHLNDPSFLSNLTAVNLDDSANFLLVDGSTLKNVDELSTGQKCAVTLPILLTEHSRALVLDQPEDHLDNAYLVENVIVGINNRSDSRAQTIIATHNANIPVLGSASKVVLLKSDGKRGYVDRFGPYDHPQIVRAITSLMEGGEDAFRRRASFYKSHGLLT
ncbi:AAA family ATPase [Arthrobacter sp. NPDC056691]|uniref:AAA family ATPase n=1 Tax=Arthrobacter sp. NPDC056691 TaxID=3345913 RepID=UPI00366C98B3